MKVQNRRVFKLKLPVLSLWNRHGEADDLSYTETETDTMAVGIRESDPQVINPNMKSFNLSTNTETRKIAETACRDSANVDKKLCISIGGRNHMTSSGILTRQV